MQAMTLAPSVARLAIDSFPSKGEQTTSALSSPVQAKAARPEADTARVDERKAKIEKTAHDFEASFLSVMLGQVFSGVETSAPFGGGQGEQMYKSFLSDAFAKSMAQHGGIGVSRAVAAELIKLQGVQQ